MPYLYELGTLDGVYTMLKFNAATGSTTFVCQDPLCSHSWSDDCPFAMADYCCSDGDMVYYRRFLEYDTGNMWGLCTYDITEQKARLVCETDVCDTGFAVFYQGMYYSECISEEGDVYYLTADMHTGEIRESEIMPELPQIERPTDRFQWTEQTLTDRKSGAAVLSGVNYAAFFEEIVVCYVTEPEPAFIGHCDTTGKDIYDTCGGKLYIVSADDMNVKTVECGRCIAADVQQVGKYLVVSYGAFRDNNGTELWNPYGGGRIVYDTASGEVNIYEDN